jgi:hypothetical protein
MADKRKNRTITDRQGTRERIHKLLSDIESRFESESGKASVADYIRLLQLERELDEEDGPREIRVTWVEPKKAAITE